jgi:hypothetical protein
MQYNPCTDVTTNFAKATCLLYIVVEQVVQGETTRLWIPLISVPPMDEEVSRLHFHEDVSLQTHKVAIICNVQV